MASVHSMVIVAAVHGIVIVLLKHACMCPTMEQELAH